MRHKDGAQEVGCTHLLQQELNVVLMNGTDETKGDHIKKEV